MTHVLVVSDFNSELMSRYLRADRGLPSCTVTNAPFNQVYQTLSGIESEGDALFLWPSPEGVLPSWNRQLDGKIVSLDDLLSEVDRYIEAVKASAKRHRLTLAATFVRSRVGRGLGLLDWGSDGDARRLTQINLRIAEALDGVPNVYVMDAQRWIDGVTAARNGKYWYSMKSPFIETVFQTAARDVKAALRAVSGLTRKLLILDLDNTVWGGVVGELGWQGLRLGGHDPVGEAFVDFQQAAKTLSRRGIALAVVSKNDEFVALEAIDNHPEMVLRRSDLAGWRINWEDKAANISALVRELNLGLDAVVFIDDNPTERGRVREALPQVLVPEWPKDPNQYADALRQLDCFDLASITAEDRSRVDMYSTERSRQEARESFTSMDDWLRSLEIQVVLERAGDANLKRLVQLVNKTNQLNLTTCRLTEAEMLQWVSDEKHHGLVTLTVIDRFGNLGLTGVLSWLYEDDALHLVDFILSCRAMGRMVEEVMVHLAVDAARKAQKKRVIARLLPTERNGPCREFWQKSGFDEPEPNLFIWDADTIYPVPDCVSVSNPLNGV